MVGGTNTLFVFGGGKGCHLDCMWTNRLFLVKQVVSGTNRLFVVGGDKGCHLDCMWTNRLFVVKTGCEWDE